MTLYKLEETLELLGEALDVERNYKNSKVSEEDLNRAYEVLRVFNEALYHMMEKNK